MNSHRLYPWFAAVVPPGSRAELFFRSIYHRLIAARWINAWQQRRSRRSYRAWRKAHKGKVSRETVKIGQVPKVTFLLALTPARIEETSITVRSLLSQALPGWELLLLAEADPPEYSSLPANYHDPRIKLVAGSGPAGLDILKSVSGDFVVCCSPGDLFFSDLLGSFHRRLAASPAAEVYFYDCEYRLDQSAGICPYFKPSSVFPELLVSVNYLSRSFIRKSSLEAFFPPADQYPGLLDREYFALLRLVKAGASFDHIPQVLVTQDYPMGGDPGSLSKMLGQFLFPGGSRAVTVESTGTARKIEWGYEEPSIAIVIPTRNRPARLKSLLDSISSMTDYPAYSIHLVDNASDMKEMSPLYAALEKNSTMDIIHFDRQFNYSKAINLGVSRSDSELVLLLNNDMQILHPDWLRQMAQWATLPSIGVVGAKLLRPNHTIQHAGLVLGMQSYVGHLYLNAPDHYFGLAGSLDWYRNVSAVTGACQMIRRSVFDELGGYDEGFELVFSDVDFCLRAIQRGYRNLYAPFVSLIHYEGRSRGYQTPLRDIDRAFRKWEHWLARGDPYFSPTLTGTPMPACRLDADGPIDRRQSAKVKIDAIRDRLDDR
jgi:GT2 family glycosyltransferase